MSKRINKTKPQVVQDIKAVQEAERKRELIRKVIFPFMLELNDSIGFVKIFLQTAATAAESVADEKKNKLKIVDLIPRIKEVFKYNDKKVDAELQKYIRLFDLLKDETVHDFGIIIQTMPRVIEQYFIKEADKSPIMNVPIDKILG